MIKVYTDAATQGNPGLSGAGILLVGDDFRKQLSLPLDCMTNHEAEFKAVLLALQFLAEEKLFQQTLFLYSDSKIVVQTIDQNFAKDPVFARYLYEINQLIAQFQLVIIQWIPESKNKGADHLARQGLQKNRKNKS